MFRVFVEEAASLASLVLFIGMIAVWAQLIPQLWAVPWRRFGGLRCPPGDKPDAWRARRLWRGQGGGEASPLNGESALAGRRDPQRSPSIGRHLQAARRRNP